MSAMMHQIFRSDSRPTQRKTVCGDRVDWCRSVTQCNYVANTHTTSYWFWTLVSMWAAREHLHFYLVLCYKLIKIRYGSFIMRHIITPKLRVQERKIDRTLSIVSHNVFMFDILFHVLFCFVPNGLFCMTYLQPREQAQINIQYTVKTYF